MFDGATAFNGDLENWNTAKVTNMGGMFKKASSFNGDIGNWNTASVTDMKRMFSGATSFNEDIGGWNTAKVTKMNLMFSGATSFNQDIGGWNVEAVMQMLNMFNGATLSPTNYDSLLVGWNRQNLESSGTFHRGGSQYRSNVARDARANMISSTSHNWGIRGRGPATQIQPNDPPTNIFLSSTSIKENAGANAVVGTLSTNGGASSHTYALVAGAGATDNASFRISGTALQLIVSADYEAKTTYAVRLKVDGVTPAVEKQFTITVRNVNEHPPVFTSSAMHVVAEGMTAVATVTATDADLGQRVRFTLTGGDDVGLFSITPTGVLTFKTAPDYESPSDMGMNNLYEVIVTGTDGQHLPMTDMQTLAITVTDANEAPTASDSTFSVAENSAPQALVGSVVGTDPDQSSPNNVLTYAITGGDTGNVFAIDPGTGAVTVAGVLDYETTTAPYSLEVTVTDGGSSPLSGMATITITVEDVNEAPTAPVPVTSTPFSVAENSAMGTAVGSVTATDPDQTSPNNVLTYAITNGNTGNAFVINPTTGEITVADALDYETTVSYSLVVTVTDGGSPSRSDTGTITITVTDVDENTAPVFANGATATVSYAENGTTAVTTVIARDADAGQTVSFTLTGGADESLFSITSAGELTFTTAPDYEMPTDAGGNNEYDVTITATDNGMPAMMATQALTITVTDENDNAPVFAGGTTASISYAENGMTAVTTVIARDADAGQTVSFTLTGRADSGQFSITPAGVLTFNTAPNYEMPTDMGGDNEYKVTVTADDGTPVATQALTITVTDVVNEVDNPTDHFVLKITTTAGTNPANKSFTFYTEDTNYDIDWDNDGMFEDTGVSGNQPHTFATAGVKIIRFRSLNDIYINNQADREKYSSIEQWGTAVWNAEMDSAFQGARNLTMNSNAGIPDMSMVTNMGGMFYQATFFNGEIGGWNTAQVTDMSAMDGLPLTKTYSTERYVR